jgi:hypothetical protein
LPRLLRQTQSKDLRLFFSGLQIDYSSVRFCEDTAFFPATKIRAASSRADRPSRTNFALFPGQHNLCGLCIHPPHQRRHAKRDSKHQRG